MRSGLSATSPGRLADPLIEPNWWEFPAIIVLVTTLAAADIWDWQAEETLNYLAPIWFSLALGVSALQMGVADSRAIWSPLFWFRVAVIVYFGIGGLAPLLMNATSRIYVESFYILTPPDIQRVNLVVAVGVACVLGANLIFEKVSGPKNFSGNRIHQLRVSNDAALMGAGMYLIGSVVNYFVLIPNALGLTDFVIPGVVVNLTAFQIVGVSLLTMWSFANSKRALLGVCVLVAMEAGVGAFTLMKAAALYPMIAFMIGALSYRLTLSRLVVGCLSIGCIFGLLISPWVSYGRAEVAKLESTGGEPTLSDRLQYLTGYFEEEKKERDPEERQETLIRLTYTNAEAFMISQYDHGLPGDSLKNVVYSFIPRILWPEKPKVLVQAELATLATGTFGNSISAGYFAEAYWNLGWIGLPLLIFPIGVFFNLTTHFAARVISRGDWTYLPLLFLNMKIGMGVEEWYIGFVGTIAQGAFLYVILRIVSHWLRSAGILRALASGA